MQKKAQAILDRSSFTPNEIFQVENDKPLIFKEYVLLGDGPKEILDKLKRITRYADAEYAQIKTFQDIDKEATKRLDKIFG